MLASATRRISSTVWRTMRSVGSPGFLMAMPSAMVRGLKLGSSPSSACWIDADPRGPAPALAGRSVRMAEDMVVCPASRETALLARGSIVACYWPHTAAVARAIQNPRAAPRRLAAGRWTEHCLRQIRRAGGRSWPVFLRTGSGPRGRAADRQGRMRLSRGLVHERGGGDTR
jgi:hypothetical protein